MRRSHVPRLAGAALALGLLAAACSSSSGSQSSGAPRAILDHPRNQRTQAFLSKVL